VTGPIVVLVALVIATAGFFSILWIDVRLSRREYQRRIRGDETERYAHARARIQAQQTNHPTRLGHRKGHDV
jgi:hypothetical protein